MSFVYDGIHTKYIMSIRDVFKIMSHVRMIISDVDIITLYDYFLCLHIYTV